MMPIHRNIKHIQFKTDARWDISEQKKNEKNNCLSNGYLSWRIV